MDKNVVVIIPALNEAEAVGAVIGDLPKERLDGIIVVDNGSEDRTAEVASETGAWVVHEPERGYGAAALRGLAALEERFAKTDIVVFLDADYSDSPEELPRLILPIEQGEANFVLGSRLLERSERVLPPASHWGNKLACWLICKIWRVRYTDLGPFRAIRADALRGLNMQDRDFGWTVEMQIKAAQRGLAIREIAVPYRPRIGKSKISGTMRGIVGAGSKILYVIARYALAGLSRRR